MANVANSCGGLWDGRMAMMAMMAMRQRRIPHADVAQPARERTSLNCYVDDVDIVSCFDEDLHCFKL